MEKFMRGENCSAAEAQWLRNRNGAGSYAARASA
jgi:hypothetical protein